MKNRKNTKKNLVKQESSDFDYIQPVEAKPLEVKVYNNNFDKALKAFRSLVQKEKILSVYKDRQAYEKSSDKKRRKRGESKRKKMELENKTNFKKRSKSKNKETDNA